MYFCSTPKISEKITFINSQQGRISEAQKAIETLYGKERVAVVMLDLTTGSQGSSEPEAGWFDLFSSRYWKGILKIL